MRVGGWRVGGVEGWEGWRVGGCVNCCMGLRVRHTPAFGHPSPRGDGLPRHTDCQSIVNALSKSRCRAIPSRRGVAEGRGVSHCQAIALVCCIVKPSHWCVALSSHRIGVSHCQVFATVCRSVKPSHWCVALSSLRDGVSHCQAIALVCRTVIQTT